MAEINSQESTSSMISLHNKCHGKYALGSIAFVSSFKPICKCDWIEFIPLFIVQPSINLPFERRGKLIYYI